MTFQSAVIGILLLAGVGTVPPYALYGRTLTPAGAEGETLLAWVEAGSASGSAAGGQGDRIIRTLNRGPARDCRTCGMPPR